MKKDTKVLIYGGGAVGSIFGWRLAQSGRASVSVVCRSNYERVSKNGYAFKTARWGAGAWRPHKVCGASSLPFQHMMHEKYDYIICANKITGQDRGMIEDLKEYISPETTLVTTQNGMDVEKPLMRAFPLNTVLTAICQVGCRQTSPGVVEQTACLQRHAFVIGGHSTNDESIIRTRDTLAAMDPDFKSASCIQQARWRKLVFNSAWNSTCALTGLDTHGLFNVAGGTEMVHRLASEACHVAAASGVRLEPDLPEKTVQLAAEVAPIVPSTLQDVRDQRPIEVKPIFGYIVIQAARVGVKVPCTETVLSLLSQMSPAFEEPRARTGISPQVPLPRSVVDMVRHGVLRHERSLWL